jgi:hypothetical protein
MILRNTGDLTTALSSNLTFFALVNAAGGRLAGETSGSTPALPKFLTGKVWGILLILMILYAANVSLLACTLPHIDDDVRL